MSVSKILIEPGTRFTCDPCGFCCNFWDIHIDGARREYLLQKEWVQQKSKDVDEKQRHSLFRIVGQDDSAVIQRTAGFCSFLNEEKLCSIHSTEGMHAKPQVCLQYPNVYYRTPRGLEVYLDFSCPEVVKNRGELVTSEAVAATLAREHVFQVNSRVRLNSFTTLEWEGYEALEQTLLHILSKPWPHRQRILGIYQVCQELGENLKSDPHSTNQKVGEALGNLRSRDDASFATLLQGLNGDRAKRDLYVAIFLHWVESTYGAQIRDSSTGSLSLLSDVLRQWKGWGKKTFLVLKIEASFRKVDPVSFDSSNPEVGQILDRYLRYLVKTLPGTGEIPIAKRIAIIAINYALVEWLSKAHAAANGATFTAPESVVFGIQNVEKFLSNRLFNRLIEQKNFVANFIQTLLEMPTLPRVLLGNLRK
ncbi:MAG: YkgJ family cysteine cluster protein [Acidobacteriota bacterium]